VRLIRRPLGPAVLGHVLSILLAAGAIAAERVADPSAEELAHHPELVEARKRVAASPEDPALHNDLGNMYARVGWDDLAIAEYRQATDLEPRMYIAWTNLGTLYAKGGELGRAKSAFQTAIRIQPRAALAHYNLGVVFDREGNYDQALGSYVTAVRYEPDLLDPSVNPPIVQNRRLLEIKTLVYMKDVGTAALPLENSPSPAKGKVPPEPAPAGGGAVVTPSAEPVLLPASASGKAIAPEAHAPAPPVPVAPGSPAASAARREEAPPSGIDPRSGKKILGTLDMKRTKKPTTAETAPSEAQPGGGKTTSPTGS
jgi:tetratricopeptide (TPR) repeat protein